MATRDKNKMPILELLAKSPHVKWVLLAVITLIFTVMLYPRLVAVRHEYRQGDVAGADIKAPLDFFVEDKAATKANRQKAIEAVLTVYDYNETLGPKIIANIKAAFAAGRAIFDLQASPYNIDAADSSPEEVEKQDAIHKKALAEKIRAYKTDFETKIGVPISSADYKTLSKETFADDIAVIINRIVSDILLNGVVANKEVLLKESDRGITLRRVGEKTEQVVEGLKKFFSLEQSKAMVRVLGQPLLKDADPAWVSPVVNLAQSLIQPNLTLNRLETEERKKQAAAEVKPVLYQIKAGEMLVREGEIITPLHMLKLNTLKQQTQKEPALTSSVGAAGIVFCLLAIIYVLSLQYQTSLETNHNKNLLFLTTVLLVVLFVAKVIAALPHSLTQNASYAFSTTSIHYAIPISAGAMIVCIFLGLRTAMSMAVVIAACTAVIFENRFELFIYFFLSGAMAAYWTTDCRERKVYIKAGFKLGVLNVILVSFISTYLAESGGIKILWDWAFALLGGIVAGILTAGISPLVELAFGYTTDIKLLELSNLDQPILRRLMIEAPGTYHHSVIVGSLVEAAASDIGANPLLAKVCGYYHDIGKINKPLYFIENQRDGKNKHDKLAPSLSKHILISHVKDGVAMAREHKLGEVIAETIRQSHGTSLISYFYEKAKQQNGDKTVNMDDYRYPGPKPQTREAGLVMLADVSEAASRSLTNPTPARIQGVVQRLFNKVFTDGQLSDCELTLKDLNNIAKSFNKILNGIYHHRVEYADNPSPANGEKKDAGSHRQSPKQTQARSEDTQENGDGHLKRLGLS